MLKPALIALSRWAEIADSPAAVAAVSAVVIFSLGASSCNVMYGTPPARTPSASAIAGLPTAAGQGEPVIRVRLMQDAREVEIGGPVRIAVGPIGRASAARSLATPVKIMRVESGWLLRDGAGLPEAFASSAPGSSSPEALRVRVEGAGKRLTISGGEYPGEIVLFSKPKGRSAETATPTGAPVVPAPAPPLPFDVIEHLGLEAYLPGVISRELLPNWSLTAFKAQAVAARSYAMHERERSIRGGEAFDVESNQLDQMYGGVVDHPVSQRAVLETRGMALTTGGRLLRAYYSSTCGGRPGAARHVWPTTRGFEFNLDAPIQGTQGPEMFCAFSPRFTWSAARSGEDVNKRLAAFGRDQGLAMRGLKKLARVATDGVTEDGRPTSYKLTDLDGRTYTVSAEQLRTALNWTGSSGQPGVTSKTRVMSGDLEFAPRGQEWLITGRGFGHGVGLCQYGAEGMARTGATFEQVLMHYYPGARLEKKY